MSIDQILDDIAGYMSANMTELKTSEQVGGRFSFEEVQRRSLALPGAFVTLTGTREGRLINTHLHCRGYFLMVLATAGRAEDGVLPRDRTRAIHRLLGRAMGIVAKAKDWGNSEVDGRPDVISSVNSYKAASDRNNIALFGITWEQDLRLEDPAPLTLDDLLLVSTDYQVVDTGEPIDAHDDLEP